MVFSKEVIKSTLGLTERWQQSVFVSQEITLCVLFMSFMFAFLFCFVVTFWFTDSPPPLPLLLLFVGCLGTSCFSGEVYTVKLFRLGSGNDCDSGSNMPWNMNTDKTYSVILNVVATGVILIRTEVWPVSLNRWKNKCRAQVIQHDSFSGFSFRKLLTRKWFVKILKPEKLVLMTNLCIGDIYLNATTINTSYYPKAWLESWAFRQICVVNFAVDQLNYISV